MTLKKEAICCPHCGKQNTWNPQNPTRPFCSDRCKLIDLGAWADEQHHIPGGDSDTPPEDDPGENT